MNAKTHRMICTEPNCNAEYFVRPQHYKIQKRCPACQEYNLRKQRTEIQRRRRARKKQEEKLINNK